MLTLHELDGGWQIGAADDAGLTWLQTRYGSDVVTVPRSDLARIAADARGAGMRFAPGAARVGNADHRVPRWGGSTSFRDREL